MVAVACSWKMGGKVRKNAKGLDLVFVTALEKAYNTWHAINISHLTW